MSLFAIEETKTIGWSIHVRGTVQGVGFRPTVYKLAQELGITGSIWNDGAGVAIEAYGNPVVLSQFVNAIKTNAPPLAVIEEIASIPLEILEENGLPREFAISKSNSSAVNTNITPDAATCQACIEDIFSPSGRRFRYPFTNCTDCGPRLSIIEAIPYDRATTSMAKFVMCAQCQEEYDDPSDRRFHAQPNACHVCGPKAWLEDKEGHAVNSESLTAVDDIDATAKLIQQGKIIAIKGLGGFHLACDATNEAVMKQLRQRKVRSDKPFALMARDINMIRKYCSVSAAELALLQNHKAAIVLLTKHNSTGSDSEILPKAIAPNQSHYGFMLPYTPLHHLLLDELDRPIVLTSGNVSDEPQCINNEEAKERLVTIADFFLLHNRDIINRLDDSVVRFGHKSVTVVRRARGFAPAPIALPKGFAAAPEILAMGGELKNTFCLLKGCRAVLSQHMGDLEDYKTYQDYQRNLKLYTDCFDGKPERIAIDLHPEYLSSKLGHKLSEQKNIAIDQIQHHHAHIASCLADNDWPLEAGPVLGIALDGLGFGIDQTFWGGEFLLADYSSFERLATFKPVAMLGGAQAIREPWRNTYAHLVAAMGWPNYKQDYNELELTHYFEGKPLAAYNSMLSTKTGTPLASSCGRLFDAVAAAIGICRDHASYEGQAAIEMEALVDVNVLAYESETLAYTLAIAELTETGLPYLEPLPMWQGILGDLTLNTPPSIMAARFQRGLAKSIFEMVEKLCSRNDARWLSTVALSGGVFQNQILLNLVKANLEQAGYKVLVHNQVPANDGGIALGQAVIAAAKQIQEKERDHVSWHTWAGR
ncbi:MAG: carbamoyltransferase HypF [Candidatus Obscuribacterales bacterium]|jgi:hydrogenase maturation protein HypF